MAAPLALGDSAGDSVGVEAAGDWASLAGAGGDDSSGEEASGVLASGVLASGVADGEDEGPLELGAGDDALEVAADGAFDGACLGGDEGAGDLEGELDGALLGDDWAEANPATATKMRARTTN